MLRHKVSVFQLQFKTIKGLILDYSLSEILMHSKKAHFGLCFFLVIFCVFFLNPQELSVSIILKG